jgi:cytochrome c oxidase cbb3-type subunit 4
VIVDINDLRSIITVVTLIMFVGIVIWTYSARRRQAFDEAANLPFDDESFGADALTLGNKERNS